MMRDLTMWTRAQCMRWITVSMIVFAPFWSGCSNDPSARAPVVERGMSLNELVLNEARDCADLSGLYPQELIDGLGFQLIEEMRCMDPHWLEYYTPCKGNGCIWANGPQPLAARPEVLAALREAATDKSDYITINAAYRDVAMQYFSRWRTEVCDPNFPAAVPGKSNHQGGRAIDVQSYNYWWDTLLEHGFEHPLANDRPHFELVGTQAFRDESEELKVLGVMAFQRLWNKNNPDDQIEEDGIYGPMTKERLGNSPVEGFPEYGCLEPETCEENPCGEGCLPESCDAFCQQNPCVEVCGQDRCDAYCDRNPCGEGCDASSCAAYCEQTPCGVGCDAQGCSDFCDEHPCDALCDRAACDDVCVTDPCDDACDDRAQCDALCALTPCADGCDEAACTAYCDENPCDEECDETACETYCLETPCADGCDQTGCHDPCVDTPCAEGCDATECAAYCDAKPCGVGCDASGCREFCQENACGEGCPTQPCAVFCIKHPCDASCGQEACDAFCAKTPCAPDCPTADACVTPDPDPCRDDVCDDPAEGDDVSGDDPSSGDQPNGTDSFAGDGKGKGCAASGGFSTPWMGMMCLSVLLWLRRRKEVQTTME